MRKKGLNVSFVKHMLHNDENSYASNKQRNRKNPRRAVLKETTNNIQSTLNQSNIEIGVKSKDVVLDECKNDVLNSFKIICDIPKSSIKFRRCLKYKDDVKLHLPLVVSLQRLDLSNVNLKCYSLTNFRENCFSFKILDVSSFQKNCPSFLPKVFIKRSKKMDEFEGNFK